ncbi:MAG: response regulator [Desulfobacterales bacterium]|nr:response regulator [Desulfobacterales bacterium]
MNKKADELTILVADDEGDIRDGAERILKRIGFRVLKAARGDEAQKMAEAMRPDMVLLDLKMPGQDGLEVLKFIRQMDPRILVIIITGYATVEAAIEAMKRGAYDFIPKPFEPDQLRIVVNRTAEKIRLTREAEQLEQEKLRTLADLDTEKSRIHSIVESLPDGVLVTNTAGNVVLMNPACRQLMGLAADVKPGRPIDAYVPDEALCRLIMDISQGRILDYEDIPAQEFALPDGKYLRARAQPVLGDRKECLGAVVNFADITTLKIVDRLKSEFVSKVSHELRSPLSTIHEQLATVIGDLVDRAPVQDQHILTRAKEKTKGMISLINDLLDMSRIDEGLICREPRPVLLEELLRSIVDFLDAKAQAKHQVLTLVLPEAPLPELQADPLALESIFGNLIANAITYTPDGGSIRVEVDLAGVNVRVRVIDNGIGIAEKHLARIFERFYRVKDEATRYITGTGLGLPIVKGLLEAMGGIIEVQSTPGEGSIFTVLLPAAPAKTGEQKP